MLLYHFSIDKTICFHRPKRKIRVSQLWFHLCNYYHKTKKRDEEKNECREQFANMYFTWDTKCIKHFMRCDLEGNIITLRGNANSNTFLMQMCCVWSLYKLYIYGWQNTTKKKYMSSKHVFQIIKLSDLINMVNSCYTVINRPMFKKYVLFRW